MPRIDTFDYGRAIQSGTQNALNTIKARSAVNTLNRQQATRNALQQAGGDLGAASDRLLQQGHPQAANRLGQQRQERRSGQLQNELQGMEFITKTAPMVRDQRSYEMWLGKLNKLGLNEDGRMPEEYDPELVKFLSGKAQEQIDILTKNLPGGMAQDYLQQDGQLEPFGTAYERYSPSAMETEGGGGLKAPDENAMHRYSASLYGGAYDPRTGEITGLNPDESRNVLAMSTRAAQLMSSGQVGTRSEAVSQAATELGIEVPNLQARTETAPAVDRAAEERFPTGQQPGPTRERAGRQGGNQASENRVIRYDAQGNRIE